MQDLHQLLLLGTEADPLAAQRLAAWAKPLGLNLSSDLPTALLQALAAKSVLQKAAQSLRRYEGPLPARPADDPRPACSDKGQRLCARVFIYDRRTQHLFMEWLEILQAKGQRLPDEWLPALLDYSLNLPRIQPKLLANLGSRGHWLVQQQPKWQAVYRLYTAEDEQLFFFGSAQERSQYWQRLRQEQAQKALELLDRIWASEGSNQRKQWLQQLLPSLQASDQAWLETQYEQESSKEIRQALAEMLRNLPGSSVQQRILGQLSEWLQWNASTWSWNINLPKDWDKAWQEWGFQAKHKPLPQESEKANWLAQFAQFLPSEQWLAWMKVEEVETLLETLWDNTWRAPLLWALAKSLQRFPNRSHILAYHDLVRRKIQDKYFYQIPLNELPLPKEDFDAIMLQYLPSRRQGFTEDHPAWQLLLSENVSTWSPLLMEEVNKLLHRSTELGELNVFQYFIHSVFKRAALACPLSSCRQIWQSWLEQESHYLGNLTKIVKEFMEILVLRAELYEWSVE